MKQLSAWSVIFLLTPFAAQAAEPVKKQELPGASTSMQAEIEPAPGKMVSRPSRESARTPFPATEPSQPRLYKEELSTVPGGGRLVDLSGNFMFAIVAVVEPGGTVTTMCEPAAASPGKAQAHPKKKEANRVK